MWHIISPLHSSIPSAVLRLLCNSKYLRTSGAIDTSQKKNKTRRKQLFLISRIFHIKIPSVLEVDKKLWKYTRPILMLS